MFTLYIIPNSIVTTIRRIYYVTVDFILFFGSLFNFVKLNSNSKTWNNKLHDLQLLTKWDDSKFDGHNILCGVGTANNTTAYFNWHPTPCIWVCGSYDTQEGQMVRLMHSLAYLIRFHNIWIISTLFSRKLYDHVMIQSLYQTYDLVWSYLFIIHMH